MNDKYANLIPEIKRIHLDKVKDYIDSLYEVPNLDTLFIEMTLNCNEHCRHCGSCCGDVKMYNQLTDDEIVNCLEVLASKVDNLPYLNITGGEPMLRPGFMELMNRIHRLGYTWGMTTNGTFITSENVVRDLYEAGMTAISISIDGLEKTHDWFRQVDGAYAKAMKAIELLCNTPGIKFSNAMVTTVAHAKNIDELDDLYEEMKALDKRTKYGLTGWRIINLEPIGRAKGNKEIELKDEDYIRVIEFIKSHRASEDSFEVKFGCNHWLGVDNEHRLRRWYYKCTAGIETCDIFYNGDIGGCLDIDRKPETIQGNIRENDLLDTWNNKFEIFRKNRALESDYCADCEDKEYCRGDGFHTWDLENNRPNLCLYKILKNRGDTGDC